MARELDLQGEWQRLYERYHAMSDGELLNLAAESDGLTELAADVLRSELRDRRLTVPAAVPISSPSIGWTKSRTAGAEAGKVLLMTFYDAIEAGRACQFLESSEIDFEVRDVSQPRTGLASFAGSPAVALQLFVDNKEKQNAISVLRAKMGLFPLQEVEVTDDPVDDGAIAVLGTFEHREEAEDVAAVLDEARIWHRIVRNAEDSRETEVEYSLQVKEVDLTKAGDLVEAKLNLPEE